MSPAGNVEFGRRFRPHLLQRIVIDAPLFELIDKGDEFSEIVPRNATQSEPDEIVAWVEQFVVLKHTTRELIEDARRLDALVHAILVQGVGGYDGKAFQT